MPYLKKSLRLWSVWGMPRCLYSPNFRQDVFSETPIHRLGCLCVRTGGEGSFPDVGRFRSGILLHVWMNIHPMLGVADNMRSPKLSSTSAAVLPPSLSA
jgi:hypothetical protein